MNKYKDNNRDESYIARYEQVLRFDLLPTWAAAVSGGAKVGINDFDYIHKEFNMRRDSTFIWFVFRNHYIPYVGEVEILHDPEGSTEWLDRVEALCAAFRNIKSKEEGELFFRTYADIPRPSYLVD